MITTSFNISRRSRQGLKVLSLMAVRNVQRHWRHSIAALLSISFGFVAIALFDGFMAHIDDYFFNEICKSQMNGEVIIQTQGADVTNFRNNEWKYSLSRESQGFVDRFLASQTDVRRHIRSLKIIGNAQFGGKSDLFLGNGYDLKEGAAMRGPDDAWNTVAGIPLHMQDRSRVVAVGRLLANKFGCTTSSNPYRRPDGSMIPERRTFSCEGKPLVLNVTTEMGKVNTVRLPIGALVEASIDLVDEHLVTMSLGDAQLLLGTDRVSAYMVELTSRDKIDGFIERFNQSARATGHSDIVAIKSLETNQAQMFLTLVELGHKVKYVFLAVLTLIGGMTVGNTIRKSVQERVTEIGTLRSLGFFQRDIVLLFSLESLLLGLCATLVGVFMALSVMLIVASVGVYLPGGNLTKPIAVDFLAAPEGWLLNAMTFLALTVATGWRVSRNLSRIGVAEALRTVD